MLLRGGTKWNKKGGSGLPTFSPANFSDAQTPSLPAGAANFTHLPTVPGSSTQVGGGKKRQRGGYNPFYDASQQGGGSYGFTGQTGADVTAFGGSYFPVAKGGDTLDLTRGGNNIVKALNLTGGGKKFRKNKKARRTMKKWRQRGCSKKGGNKKTKSNRSRKTSRR